MIMIIIIYNNTKKNNTSQNQNQKKNKIKFPTKPNRKLKAITNHIFLKTFFFERFNVDGCVCVSLSVYVHNKTKTKNNILSK